MGKCFAYLILLRSNAFRRQGPLTLEVEAPPFLICLVPGRKKERHTIFFCISIPEPGMNIGY